ncbi:hypothetical protein [Ensifer adhaerens]
MDKFGNTFSKIFGVDEEWLRRKAIFNPTLDVDSPLFVDPFLLPGSSHVEFSTCAFETYEAHFTEIYRLLSISEEVGDKAWNAALKKFQFSEAKGMSGTCLGYSKGDVKGRAFGIIKSKKSLLWARDVIKLGVKDPELFSSLSLFEGGIGADLISDMVTAISIECISLFNARIIGEIKNDLNVGILMDTFTLRGKRYQFARNPFSNTRDPLILLPEDILKHLPLFDDARSLGAAAEQNEELRDRVNNHIGEIFKVRNKADKDAIKSRAMRNAAAFQAFLDALKLAEKTPYDFSKDPEGLLAWTAAADTFTSLHQLRIADDPGKSEIDRLQAVATKIVDQFQTLIEVNRLNRLFFVDGEPRHERFAQLLFYSVAVSYCAANNLDISPESDAGAGPVDFKLSKGTTKYVIEIKLSTNSHVVKGYTNQLALYGKAEMAERGMYVVIDVGKMGLKWDALGKISKENKDFSDKMTLRLIDGTPKDSASKRG